MTDFEYGKCETCPRVMHLMGEIEKTQDAANRVIEDAMSKEIEESAHGILESIKSMVPEHINLPDGEAFIDSDQFVKILRQGAGNIVNILDEESDEFLNLAKELVLNCDGTLTMRATKAGRTVTATVCNSPNLPDGGDNEGTHTYRS